MLAGPLLTRTASDTKSNPNHILSMVNCFIELIHRVKYFQWI